MGGLPVSAYFGKVKYRLLTDFGIPEFFVFESCREDGVPWDEGVEPEPRGACVEVDLKAAPGAFEVFASHPDLCLVDENQQSCPYVVRNDLMCSP